MENRFINATHDLTEHDQVRMEWARRKETMELIRAGRKTAKMAFKDVVFLMACAAFVVTAIVVCVVIAIK